MLFWTGTCITQLSSNQMSPSTDPAFLAMSSSGRNWRVTSNIVKRRLCTLVLRARVSYLENLKGDYPRVFNGFVQDNPEWGSLGPAFPPPPPVIELPWAGNLDEFCAQFLGLDLDEDYVRVNVSLIRVCVAVHVSNQRYPHHDDCARGSVPDRGSRKRRLSNAAPSHHR